MAQRRFSSFSQIADALYPNLSREAKQREAQQERDRAEVRERSKRLAADLRAMHTSMRAERERGRR
jgi:hypothetical protein